MYKLLVSGLLIAFAACTTAEGDTDDEKRTHINGMAKDTLAQLYEKHPAAKKKVADAPGYAVFSNFGTKILLFGSGSGYGVAVPDSGKRTYMKMAELDVGVGLGVQKFRAVFVFHSDDVMKKFIDEGWEFGADAEAGAESGESGGSTGASASASGMSVYMLTDEGVSVQATVGGTKYWKYDELN